MHLRRSRGRWEDAYEVTLALDGLLLDRDPLDTLPPIRKFIHTGILLPTFSTSLPKDGQEKDHHGRLLFFPCQPKLAAHVITDHKY